MNGHHIECECNLSIAIARNAWRFKEWAARTKETPHLQADARGVWWYAPHKEVASAFDQVVRIA